MVLLCWVRVLEDYAVQQLCPILRTPHTDWCFLQAKIDDPVVVGLEVSVAPPVLMTDPTVRNTLDNFNGAAFNYRLPVVSARSYDSGS